MIRFWTIAIEETHCWDPEVLETNGIRAAFGLYLIKEGEATHLCELAASSAILWVQNAFVTEDPDFDDPEGLEHENGGELFSYHHFVDPEKHDPRFIAGPIEIDEDEDSWDAAQEAWNSNPDEPSILYTGVYELHQAELLVKRHAENVPPLSYRDPLPLFYTTAIALLPGGQPTPETDALFKEMKWL